MLQRQKMVEIQNDFLYIGERAHRKFRWSAAGRCRGAPSLHEQDNRERLGSGGRAQLADECELPGLEGDLLHSSRLGLPRAGSLEQHDDQQDC
jgi:hypothetical protein